MGATLIKQIAIPVVALVTGAALTPFEETKAVGKLTFYFGAQTGMNLYMKAVLSSSVVSSEEHLKGLPAAFVVTAIQQITAFLLFMAWILISQLTPYKYTPKQLKSRKEWLAVCLFSLSFTMNIALNNYSLSLIAISVNLIIRSCLPLSTFISQQVAARFTGGKMKDSRPVELLLMCLGVLCAAVAVVAKTSSRGAEGESKNLVFGVIVCIVSLFSGSINLALAGVLGTSVELNSLDTTVYMSVPATVLLLGPIFLMSHPVGWPHHGNMTDWQVFLKVLQLSPSTVMLAVLSGPFALGYNVLQYGIVQSLSATHTAFAGNFNKAATIALALIVGLEYLPAGYWGPVMLIACVGNIAAFTAYNIVKMNSKDGLQHAHGHGGGALASESGHETFHKLPLVAPRETAAIR